AFVSGELLEEFLDLFREDRRGTAGACELFDGDDAPRELRMLRLESSDPLRQRPRFGRERPEVVGTLLRGEMHEDALAELARAFAKICDGGDVAGSHGEARAPEHLDRPVKPLVASQD